MPEHIGRRTHTLLTEIIGFWYTTCCMDGNNSRNILPDMLSIIAAEKLQKVKNKMHISNNQQKRDTIWIPKNY